MAASSPSSWPRQFAVLLTKNRRLLSRRPVHLVVLLLSSVASVVFAWLAGRGARGPSGAFPPLTDCGMVDPSYVATFDQYNYEARYNIPLSLNEPWRGGLPAWLMSLGPTAAGISAFLILRDELQSRRWGMLKAADMSAQWLSWMCAFAALGVVNSLAGGVTAVKLPDCHALESVNFGSVFGTLLFLNLALVAASFFLAALCGTCQSTALTVFITMAMIVASSAPAIGTAASYGYYSDSSLSLNTYSHPRGSGGAFWFYGSTGRTSVEYDYGYTWDPEMGEYVENVDRNNTVRECEVPLVSYDQGHFYKSPSERDDVPKEDIFQGCYVIASATTAQTGVSGFFWYWIPQYWFMTAWSNMLGYTSLPGNRFSLALASMSPEDLAQQALANYQGLSKPAYDPNNTNGTSLFPQGSTVVTDYYYDWTRSYTYYDDNAEPESTCPSSQVSNLCSDYNSECYFPKLGYPSTGSPSVNDAMGLLVSLVVVYSILAAYFMAVFPMGNGAGMRFYFPLQLRYWLGNRRSSDAEPHVDGVKAVDVSKSYGTVHALKPFSLAMKPGEVTAILGHNGAGKSTFVNLLCCEQNPTSGEIIVNGHSVNSEPNAIAKMVGECKQDDILWPTLNASEHLELFAGIRGVGKQEMAEIVQKWLDSVDLEDVQHMRVGAFSGGMKRRLSVALATIGCADVVVLDEPTTGMDPVSRRFVWKHITAIKEGRVILLTTHAMEEADLLSDNVAIMCQGNLEAYGSPLELKTKYGSALQLSLICDKGDVETVEDAVKHTFADSLPYIKFDASDSGYSTLTIKSVSNKKQGPMTPTHAVAVPVLYGAVSDTAEVPAILVDGNAPIGVSVDSLSEFIGWLEDESSPVREFGISSSSLEEVFLVVTRHAGPSPESQHVTNQGCCCCRKRRPRTSVEVDNVEVAPPSLSHQMSHVPKAETNIASYSRKLSVITQTRAIVIFFFARSWTGRPSIVNWTIFSIFAIANMITGFGMSTLWPEASAWYLLLVTVSVLSFMLISVIAPIYADRNDGLFKMLSTQSMLERSFLLGTSLYSLAVHFAYSFVVLTLFFGSSIYRTASTPDCQSSESASSYPTDDIYNDTFGYSYYPTYDYECGYAKFGQKPIVNPYGRVRVHTGTYEGEEATMYAHIAPGGYEMVFGIIVVFSLTFPGAVLSSGFLPGFKLSLVGISLVLLAACASPGILHATYALDPYFALNYTEHIQNTHNCFESQFTAGNLDASFVECTGFSITSPYILYTPAVASILPQMGLFQTLSLSLMSDIVFYSEPSDFAGQVVTKLAESGASCQGRRCKFQYARQLYGENLGFMVLGAILLLVLGLIMATVMIYPSTYMVRAKQALGTLFKCRKKHQNDDVSNSGVEEMKEVDYERQAVHNIVQPVLVKQGTVDLEAKESQTPILSYTLRNNAQDQLPPILMHKLQKLYPAVGGAPPKTALKSLDLHVPNGQVLGLLGKNGAGKTTALKILAGMHNATSGIGLISGYDVETERNSVYERLGNFEE